MAQVEQFQPKRLESSAVGVPQPDTSGQIIGKEIGGALQDIAQTNYERQQLADNIAAETHASDFALESRKLISANNQKYAGTDVPPDKQMEDLQTQMKGLQNQYSGKMTTQGQKNFFAMKSAEVMKNQYQDAYTQALTRQTSQVHANVVLTQNNIADQNSQIWRDPATTTQQKYEAMDGLMGQLKTGLAAAQKILPGETFVKLRDDSMKNFAKAAIFGAMDTNPDLAKKLIEDKTFENQLTVQEQSSLKKDAIAYSKRNQQMNKLSEAYDTTATDRDMIGRMTSSDPEVQKPTLSEIEKAHALGSGFLPGGISDKTYEALKSYSKVTTDGDDSNFAQRMTQYNNIFKGDGDNTQKFNKLATFQASVLEDVAAGKMSRDSANSFIAKINRDFKDGINTNFNEANRVKSSGFDFFGAFADKMIKGKQEQADAKNYMMAQLMKNINEVEKNGSQVTQEDISNMSRSILKDYLRQKNPAVIGAKDVTNALISQTEGPNMLHQIETPVPGAQKVKKPDDTLISLTAPDGQKVQVHPSKLAEAWRRGLR